MKKVKKAKFGKFPFRSGIYLMNEGENMELVYISSHNKDWFVTDYPNMRGSIGIENNFFDENTFFYVGRQ